MFATNQARRVPLQFAIIMATAAFSLLASCGPPQPSRADVAQATAIADRFQTRLQGELKQALERGGPVGAVEVCAEVAPAIATDLSLETGAQVRRISLRPRNPNAEAEGRLLGKLEALSKDPVDANGKAKLVAWVEGNGPTATSYTMRAVMMQDQPCGTCHGKTIPTEVTAAIAARYPGDQATGFSSGEMRGAIVVGLPLAAQKPAIPSKPMDAN
jgi:hypothetical protein